MAKFFSTVKRLCDHGRMLLPIGFVTRQSALRGEETPNKHNKEMVLEAKRTA
jgi:hypothetical protein